MKECTVELNIIEIVFQLLFFVIRMSSAVLNEVMCLMPSAIQWIFKQETIHWLCHRVLRHCKFPILLRFAFYNCITQKYNCVYQLLNSAHNLGHFCLWCLGNSETVFYVALCVLYFTNVSAVTCAIFGFAVGFGWFFNKNCGLRSVSVFMVPDVNYTHSKLREFENGRILDRYRIATDTLCFILNRIGYCCIGENPILRASL